MVSYNDVYLKHKSGAVYGQKTFTVDFDQNIFNPVLVHFAISQTDSRRLKPPVLVVLPGDTVRVVYNHQQNTFELRGKHQAELDFCKRMWQRNLSLAGLYFEMTVPASKVPLDEFMRTWGRLRQEGDSLLASLNHLKGIRPEVATFLARQIRLRVFEILMLPASYQRENEPLRVFTQAYHDSVAARAVILQELNQLPASSFDGLSGALLGYVRYKNVSQGKPPGLTANYNMAKQLYTGFQQAWTCYIVLSNGIFERRNISKLLLDYESWVGPHKEFVQVLKGKKGIPLQSAKGATFADELEGADARHHPLTTILAKYKGRVVLLDIWASWCGPCLAEIPASIAAARRYASKGLVVVYLSADTDRSKWLQASKRLPKSTGNQFRFTDAFESPFLKRFEISAIPRYVLVDRNGAIRYPDAPHPGDPKFDEALKKLLPY